jgi:hypothetical protein
MTVPPPTPVGSQSTLDAVQSAQLPIANALAIPRLLASVGVPPTADLSAHGVGTQTHHSA